MTMLGQAPTSSASRAEALHGLVVIVLLAGTALL